MSSALAGRFLTPGPPEKTLILVVRFTKHKISILTIVKYSSVASRAFTWLYGPSLELFFFFNLP